MIPKKMIAKNSSAAVGAHRLHAVGDHVADAHARAGSETERDGTSDQADHGGGPFGHDQEHEHGHHQKAERYQHCHSSFASWSGVVAITEKCRPCRRSQSLLRK